MNIKPVLIELEDKHTTNVKSSSAALIGDKYVLTTCHILSGLLNKHIHLLQKLDEGKFHCYSRRSVGFHVFSRSETSLSQVFRVRHATLFGLFKSRHLNQFYKNHLKDWSAEPDAGKARGSNVNISEAIISTFLILAVDGNGALSDKNMNSVIFEYLKASITAVPLRICALDEVYSVSSPFGCKEFFNSVSTGIISTTLKDPSLFLSDCSSAPGCEGGLIYTKAQLYEFPIGIIISSFNWWRKDWVGFTLIADIRMILSCLLDIPTISSRQFAIPKLLEGIQKTLVQIKCGPNWGTGILISKEKRIFITNSHVIVANSKIMLFWKDKQSTAHLIYRTPKDSAVDLAILRANINWIDLEPSLISLNTHMTGDLVYCAGFPLLSNFTSPKGVSITQGNISSCNPYMIHTTCRVFPGFSGGGLFNTRGALIGIIVCNTKLQDTEEVYCRFSVAIPLGAFHNVMEEYLTSSDLLVLSQLENSGLSSPWGRLLAHN